jgi:acyl-coenzyme A synthetase/AMP-(fatty) acid ligase
MISPLNPYQLLFFNREINFGNTASNILKGNAELTGADYEKLRQSIQFVLEKSDWPYLSIDKNKSGWLLNNNWNGRFETFVFQPDIAVDRQLWAVQLLKEDGKIRLKLYLHHCLADAHSFNLFWDAVTKQYSSGSFETAPLFPELAFSKGLSGGQSKQLRTDLGIGTVRRISLRFNARQRLQLNSFAAQKGSTLMVMLLEYIGNELIECEKELDIPLKIGIALRNRRNAHQKNAFPTLVNFLPLPEDKSLTMQQKIMEVFRCQDYPLLHNLKDRNLPIAFNVLFSYQKESYEQLADFESKFTFEASSVDDNILGIHLLEYDDNSLLLHLDYRLDLASENYWKSVLSNISRKIIADFLKIKDTKSGKKPALLLPYSNPGQAFWNDFDNAAPNKTALICNGQQLSFDEIRKTIQAFEFNPQQLHFLKPERTVENIIELLAAWKNGAAVSYQQDIDPDTTIEKNRTAYVAKTSGTSASQKTILISFEALNSLMPDWKRVYNTADSVHLSLADQRFDVFFGDLLRSILSGETLLLATESERLDALKIKELIKKYRVSHFESTPSFLSYLLPELNDLSSLKAIICGSEPIQRGFYEQLQQEKYQGIQFFNSYGLTECSIDSAVSNLKKNADGYFPSGFPLGDQIISIRDKSLNIMPLGLWGEICIEGSCVGKMADGTESGLFRTGDLGMITADGLIVHGRLKDDFIKVNGRRVPSALIEQLVSSLNAVENCLCLAAENAVVLFVYGSCEASLVREKLSNSLSRYQQPDAVFYCESWPINQNGKADRKKMLEWYRAAQKDKKAWLPADNLTEKMLFECLSSRNKSFGDLNDSLISFGWNSIELLSLANELNLKGLFVPLTAFIQNPSIAFILNSSVNDSKPDSFENPNADDFDINDILSVLNN